MDSSKKAAVAILIILSVILAGVTFYISYALQQDTGPEESNAAIISRQQGLEREKTEKIIAEIPQEDCTFYMPLADLTNLTSLSDIVSPQGFRKVYSPLGVSAYENESTEDLAKTCSFDVNKGQFIFSMLIHTFNQKYTIETDYGTEEILLIIVPEEEDVKNEYISTVVDTGTIGNYSYFFGEDKVDSEQCRSIITHKKAHIRFASFLYGYDDCTGLKQLNKDVVNEFTSNLDKIINSVN